MKREPPILANHIYHIYNRGVEKRKIFMEESDKVRFIHDLFEFNDTKPAPRFYLLKNPPSDPGQFSETGSRKIAREPRKIIVEILAFALMDNHYHLLLRPQSDDELQTFMLKTGTGYARYFNEKYNRTGPLFQGRYKAVMVKTNEHLMYCAHYIHFNPLDPIEPGWRTGSIKDMRRAVEFLKEYRWSSFLDYIGKKNFPSVTQRRFLNKIFGGPAAYKENALRWLKESELSQIKSLVLED